MFRRAREFYSASDDITRIIALVAFILLLIITVPTLAVRLPGLSNGVICSSLSTVSGNGTNQSLMAQNVEPNALRLELLIDKQSYAVGEPITFYVRFINDSTVPLIIPLIPEETVFRYTGNESGLMFFVQVLGGAVLGEPATSKAPAPIRQQFAPGTLHLLGPRQRCTLPVTVDGGRLQAAGLRGGQYQVIAVYRNLYRGALAPVGALTPTPVFRDQGAWITSAEGIRSNNVIFGVGVPAPAAR